MTISSSSGRPAAGEFEVLRNVVVCTDHRLLTLGAKLFSEAYPGQFVHLGAVDPFGGAGQDAPLLRRALSIAGLRRIGEACELDFLYRVVGRGTRWLAGLRAGDSVSGIGPLGNRFPEPPAGSTAWLVAGGVGLPPLLWLSEALGAAGRPAILFLGAQTRDLIPLPTNAATKVGQLIVATDDGSAGFCGNVVQAVADHAAQTRADSARVAAYTCGPEAMMRALAGYCSGRAIQCHACLERAMACGTGVCQSCAVPISDPAAPEGWRYALCCTDGPVFNAREVDWAR